MNLTDLRTQAWLSPKSTLSKFGTLRCTLLDPKRPTFCIGLGLLAFQENTPRDKNHTLTKKHVGVGTTWTFSHRTLRSCQPNVWLLDEHAGDDHDHGKACAAQLRFSMHKKHLAGNCGWTSVCGELRHCLLLDPKPPLPLIRNPEP